MLFDYAIKAFQVKIVYYGPALSGKTTSIKNLFKHFGKEDIVKSIESTTGRTLFFDFGFLNFEGSEWDIKFLIYTTTGQDFYAITRPTTMIGTDGIIFVADSHTSMFQQNIKSWNELFGFFSSKIYDMPIVFCSNKWDLKERIEKDDLLDEIDHHLYRKFEVVNTIATKGVGIFETFTEMLGFIFPLIYSQINKYTC